MIGMSVYTKGLTFYSSIGKNKKFKIQKDGPSIRINLLCFSFCIGFFDIEDTFSFLLNERENVLKNDSHIECQKEIEKFKIINRELEKTVSLQNEDLKELKWKTDAEKLGLQEKIVKCEKEIEKFKEQETNNIDNIDNLEIEINDKEEEIEDIKKEINSCEIDKDILLDYIDKKFD